MATSVDLRAFADTVAPSVPGCPIPTIKMAVLNAAIELCQRAGIWHYDSEAPVVLESGRSLYVVSGPDDDAEVSEITGLYIDGYEVSPATADRWPTADDSGNPRIWRFIEPGEVKLWPTPSTAGAMMTFKGTLAPTYSAATLPAFLLSHHRKTVAAGAKAELQIVPGKQWSNLQSAAINQEIFESGIVAARIREMQGGTGQSLRVRPRRII